MEPPEATAGRRPQRRRYTTDAISLALARLRELFHPERHIVAEGDVVCRAGEAFENLYVLNVGCFKVVNLSADGGEQVTGIRFRGDWLGFDGIAHGRYTCDSVAMDTGEVWAIPYERFLGVALRYPDLLRLMHEGMSRELTRDRDALMSICSLPVDARVAEFLCQWSESLASRNLRSDQITLRLKRSEIGDYLGMTIESVSRAVSKLSRLGLIEVNEQCRRDLRIPDALALRDFVRASVATQGSSLQ